MQSYPEPEEVRLSNPIDERSLKLQPSELSPASRARFLKDVLICSLGAYGGPKAHINIFLDQLVTKRKYLSEEELLELVAGGIGIFLPGLLLISFVYPIWADIRQMRAVKLSLRGINAVAKGMIAVAAVILFHKNGFSTVNVGVSVGAKNFSLQVIQMIWVRLF
jgi:chromate transport protein ChrA